MRAQGPGGASSKSYPNAVIVGLTATPCRQDGAGLGEIFEKLVETAQIPELIEQGFLVGTRVFAPSAPDLKGVHVRRGDYVESELAERVDVPKLTGDIVEHWLRHADRQRTVCFAVGVSHAVHLRDEFRRHDVAAEYIDGKTPIPERDAILARLKAGTVDVVVQLQRADRRLGPAATRLRDPGAADQELRPLSPDDRPRPAPVPDKTHLLVLDHAGLTLEHGLVEEPVVWSSTRTGRRTRLRAGSSTGAAERKLIDCPECRRVFWRDAGVCPSCGWRPRPKPKAVAVRPGDLVEQRSGQFSTDDKRAFHAELHGIQLERGYKPGWIYHTVRRAVRPSAARSGCCRHRAVRAAPRGAGSGTARSPSPRRRRA